ncbi:helix-turn-helix domain-containing protein [Streptomyces sp. MA5143a]|uniref:helix-turn-helix domain-containing protein n=1 Tax=Streptomyces sp. MA5143a TaxID=2083010 RepID=UPI0021591FEB|nr:helix-turn-helix domain-containing protein [Streptomyces sp. MA5143a]
MDRWVSRPYEARTTERDLARRARHRLAVLRHAKEVSGNIAATCRYYGISRQCFYTWRRRYEPVVRHRVQPPSPASKSASAPTPTRCPVSDLR